MLISLFFIYLSTYSPLMIASDQVEISYGTAISDKGEVVYKEKHISEFANGKLKKLKTLYFINESESFGSITSNFSSSLFVPNYQFVDKRHGLEAGVKRNGSDVIAYAIEENPSVTEEKKIPIKNDTVAGQGLHNYLMTHLSDFVKDTNYKKQIQFLTPANQKVYNFRIATQSINPNKGTIKIRIEADSWLFRLIAPHIDVTYEIKSNRLLEYQGPSNLLSSDKKNMNVTIAYKYP